MKHSLQFFYFLIITLLISCGKNQLDCDSYTAKTTVIDIFQEDVQNKIDKGSYDSYIKKMKDYPETFFKNNVELINIRTTKKEDDLKLCECKATLKIGMTDDTREILNSNVKDVDKNNPIIRAITDDTEYNISYTLQETKEGIFAETELIDELIEMLGLHYAIKIVEEELEEKNGKIKGNIEYPNEGKEYDMCFIEITSTDKNGQSAYWLQLKKDGKNYIGDYGFYPHYESDSPRGTLSGKETDLGIEGFYSFSSEGNDYNEPFLIKLKDNRLTYISNFGNKNESSNIMYKTICK